MSAAPSTSDEELWVTLLAARDLTKAFGAVQALRGVSLELQAGEIRAVCGENGAGKSTFMRLLLGLSRPDTGTIAVDAQAQQIRSPQHAQQLGLAMVAQELSLAPDLSILDNIWLGSRVVPLLHRRKVFRQEAETALRKLGVAYDLDRKVRTLNMGEKQIVEIARLLVRRARILILDEPSATLSDIEIEKMLAALRILKAEGHGILYVTHRLGEVFQICDTVTVLRNGQTVAERNVRDLDRNELIALMLGRDFEEMYPESSASTDTRGLVVRNLSVEGRAKDLSFVAPRGQVTCLAGQVGAGAAAVVRALAGLVPGASGEAELDGVPLRFGSRIDRVARNVTFVSEDRAGEGLFRRNVLENLLAGRLAAHSTAGLLSWRRMKRHAADLGRRVTIDARRLGAGAFDLSGGNQQKILFARALGGDKPGVILVNEPTRGVDVGAKAEVYRLLRECCRAGYVVLMTSSDLEEVVGIADTVLTMYRGAIVSHYKRGQVGMASILADITHPSSPSLVAS